MPDLATGSNSTSKLSSLPSSFLRNNSPEIIAAEADETSGNETKEELDLVKIVNDLIKSGNRIPPDLRVDDRELFEFPNFFSWCMSKEGAGQAPFARQLALATQMLAEACPKCTNPAFWDIHMIPVDFPAEDFPTRVTFLEYGVCPKCKSTRSQMLLSGEMNVPNELDACIGQRGGKSGLLRLLGPYIIHKWLKINKPVETLGLLKQDILVGTFVGLTFAKAVELLWQPILNGIDASPWFNKLHALLDKIGEEQGIELYRKKDTFIHYNYKALFLAPSGPNKRTLRGATRFLVFIDELGWFPHGEENESMERASANEVYKSLANSLVTVRKTSMKLLREGYNNIMPGLMGCISSPSNAMDRIMTLVRNNAGRPDKVTAHLSSWEFNPLFTKADFADEYNDDPVKAERDFGANPPASENPWISNIDTIRGLFNGRKNAAKYKYAHRHSTSGHEERFAEITKLRVPQPCPGTILSIDAGATNNSFAIAITAPKITQEELTADVIALIEVAPQRGRNSLSYTYIVREMIDELIETFNVKLVLADRWNSLKLLQDIEAQHGIFTVQYSMAPADFTYIYDCILDDSIQYVRFPKMEMEVEDISKLDIDTYPHCFQYTPVTHLFNQFLTVAVNKRGIVDKGSGYTDDILRASCLGLAFALDIDSVEQYQILGERHTVVNGPVGTRRATSYTSGPLGTRSGGIAQPKSTTMAVTTLGARG